MVSLVLRADMKIFANVGPSGDPIATPPIRSSSRPLIKNDSLSQIIATVFEAVPYQMNNHYKHKFQFFRIPN